MIETTKNDSVNPIVELFKREAFLAYGNSVGYAYIAGFFESLLVGILNSSSLTNDDIDIYRKVLITKICELKELNQNESA